MVPLSALYELPRLLNDVTATTPSPGDGRGDEKGVRLADAVPVGSPGGR